MKTLTHFSLSILAALTLATSMTSCADGPNARRGAVIGGLGGAAVGGIIGNQSGHALEGAAIGAGAGALAGNMIGDSRDRRYYRRGYYY
jgi:uncharacterized protein YcfJ